MRDPARPAPAVLGIDLGTTEVRVGLLTVDGRLLALASAGYTTARDGDGRAEQDPDDWWGALAAATRQVLEAAGPGAGAAIVALAVVGQGPTLAILDAAGRPVRPAITWQDRRVVDPGFGLLPRIAWLAREDRAALERATWLTTAWDALAFRLTDVAATSLQRHERPIDPAALRAAGVDVALVPPPVPVGSRLGAIAEGPAAELGLRAGIAVIAGVNDGSASMLGAGLLEPGDAVDTGGASGGIGIYADGPRDLPGTFCAPAPLEGRWVLGGAMASTGAALDWLAGPILGGIPLETLLLEAEAAPPDAGGLVFLPYLAGERAPLFDDGARGTVAGLTLGTTRGELVRAVLDGAAFAIRHVAEPIVAAGVPVRELRLAGRPARSALWARIKADATGFPVATLAVDETAVVGAAILAAHGAGLVPSLEAGIRALVRVERRVAPDPALRTDYDARYAAYRALHPAIRPIVPVAGGTLPGR